MTPDSGSARNGVRDAVAGDGVAARDLGAELADALAASLVEPQEGRREVDPGPKAATPGTIVLAWSGGVDSSVLLHLLLHDARVAAAVGDPRVVVAHLDHAMRPDSAAAAAVLVRTAEAWGVDVRSHRLAAAPESEEEARGLRYAWLAGVADELAAEEIWTAHHADDQAETVLFRALRGTGIAGLTGIPARRGRVRRPFLLLPRPVWRADLQRYAVQHDLPVLPDPSNDEPVATRNRIRNEVMPLLADIVPGAAEALLRLARNAARASDEADALAEFALSRADDSESHAPRASDGIPAHLWAESERPLRRALVRHLADRAGVALSEAATLAVLDLPPDSQSGRGVDLPGGLRFEREFDRWRLFSPAGADAPSDRRERIEFTPPAAGSGSPGARTSGSVWLGGRERVVRWAVGEVEAPGDEPASLRLHVPRSRFPLTLRAWRPGDRITRSFGTTPVAKVWAEARVPRRDRTRRWVLADREGTVLAAEGLGAARLDRTIEGSSATPVTLHLRLDVEE
ncbi:MAG TPA: tRNA lysidine(34) synthetase TilS [Longimicrobiales bacterium]|nr:tRNA lysidine(34) synthetase TilS [Longimicrobiales bacterium]